MPHQCNHSSSFHVSCFRPSPTADDDNHHAPPTPPQTSGKTAIATTLYHTSLGLFSLAWSRTFLGHSLRLHLHPLPASLSFSTLHFHLHIKPFLFWKKYGYKKLSSSPAVTNEVRIFWDLSGAKFGSGPEPDSGFYIAVVVDGEMTLLVGDCIKEAFARTRARKPAVTSQALVLRREHVFGNEAYITKTRFGGKNREISIDCRVNEESKLCFSIDKKMVLQIKRLPWKFRGNERIEVDGVSIQVSWDVYNWLFDRDSNDGHAVFMFRFETHEGNEVEDEVASHSNEKNGVVSRRTARVKSGGSSSASSMLSLSSGSSGGSSSVTEWGSVEESELSAASGFSLLVYAWKN